MPGIFTVAVERKRVSMAETAGKRARTTDADDLLASLPRVWRTGTSKVYWRLRAEGQCKEALELLYHGAAQEPPDAEALFELADLHRCAELGIHAKSEVSAHYMRGAAKAGHPRALVWSLDSDDPEREGRFRAIRRFIDACDDYQAKWEWYWTEVNEAPLRSAACLLAREKASLQLLELAVKSGDALPETHYLRAALATHDFEPSARMGYPRACFAYASPQHNFAWAEPLPMATRCCYLELGARQGHGGCIDALCNLLFEQESVRDWGRAARLLTSPYTPRAVQSSWFHRRCPDNQDPSKVFYAHRLRELYAYGRYCRKVTDVVGYAPLVALYWEVCDAARRSTIALLGTLRRRLGCPKDVALMMARPLWESRQLYTEAWRPTRPLSSPEQSAMTK
jgi:hypothetical protein